MSFHAPEPSATIVHKTTGIILAGGIGQRLGGPLKANIRVGGHTLLERVTCRLSHQCVHLHITTGKHDPELFSARPEMGRIADPGKGPAAGFVAAHAHLMQKDSQPEFLLAAAVDTPFYPTDFLERAMEKIGHQDAIIGAFDGRQYPTNSLWRFASLKSLVRTVANQNRGPSFFALLDRLNWGTLDYGKTDAHNPFLNVNTMADLLECNRRATGQPVE